MRQDALRRSEKILEVSPRIFAYRGTEVALETIAQASGVGIATLYRNYPSREPLIEAVTEHALDHALTTVKAALRTAATNGLHAWRSLVIELSEAQLGALTESIGRTNQNSQMILNPLTDLNTPTTPSSSALPKHLAIKFLRATKTLEALISHLQTSGDLQQRIAVYEVIAAIALISRPQPN